MYIPAPFHVTDVATLHAFIRAHSFGVLITAAPDGLAATHLPFVLDASRGELGTLVAHMARGNPYWGAFDGTAEALAIFTGPHAYVSPRWYSSERNVPTWNYTAVHATGVPRLVEDPDRIRRNQDELVARYEAGAAAPWTMTDAPAHFIDGMLRGIAAFDLPIGRLEGKFKLSQNKSAADRAGAVAGLRATGDPLNAAVADLMAGRGT